MHRSVIRQLRKGYSNEMRSKGVSQGASNPACFDQVQQLLQAMETVLNDSEPFTVAAVMAARDSLIMALSSAPCGTQRCVVTTQAVSVPAISS